MEEHNHTTATDVEQNDQPTVAYILGQIEKIFDDNRHIQEALAKLGNVKSEGPGDLGAQAKAQGIADVVKCHETTNQQLLSFYKKIYDDLTDQGKKRRAERVDLVKSVQLSMLDTMRMALYQHEDDLLACANRVQGRLDALCTDILCDKI
ncbi:MAG: hypothetical protein IJX28_00310 [Clostridia bacterium]|nr:hypothetical protein [Clostridia bacterium]